MPRSHGSPTGRRSRERSVFTRIHVVDSHTEGEPTRVISSGAPDLGPGALVERVAKFREQYDWVRSLLLSEPRGSPDAVGAHLSEAGRGNTAAAIYFNNVGYLGMCGHGTIGVVVTLAHLGRIPGPGVYRIETIAGSVRARLHDAHAVTIENVRSRRWRRQVAVEVPGYGRVKGDIAYGGNWFFLIDQPPVAVKRQRLPELLRFTNAVRGALGKGRVRGEHGAEIDHIELSGPPIRRDADACNFVLCPGGAYDRSPCGTGTSAKMACLFADGELKSGEPWRQESIVGTLFEGRFRADGDGIIPSIRGSAFITGEADLVVDPSDPLRPEGSE